jgi:hypothetical protein
MITSVQCNMHYNWTCELVDNNEEGTSSSSSDKKAIGWLEESFIRRVKPEVIARPGVVLLLQNLVTTAFLQSQEDDDDDDYDDIEDVFSITEQQQQTQKQKVEQMILIGDKTVIHMWLPEESSVAITNEQFQQCQQLQLQRNLSNIHKETTDPNNSSIEVQEEDHEFNNPQLVASPKQNNHHTHVPIITNVDITVPPQQTTSKSLTHESSIPNNNLWSTNDFSLSLCSSTDTSIVPPVDSAELHTITTDLPLNISNVSSIIHPQQQQQQQECITTQSNSNNTLFVDVAQQSNKDDLVLFHATKLLDDLSD